MQRKQKTAKIPYFNLKGLAQVVRTLVLVDFSPGLRFESPWMQTILWGQPTGKARVVPDPCLGSALHGLEVYLTWVGVRSDPILKGFLVIKKKKSYKPMGLKVL